MRKVRLSPSARDDLADILKNVTRQSGSLTIAERAVRTIRDRCGTLASLPGTMGRAR